MALSRLLLLVLLPFTTHSHIHDSSSQTDATFEPPPRRVLRPISHILLSPPAAAYNASFATVSLPPDDDAYSPYELEPSSRPAPAPNSLTLAYSADGRALAIAACFMKRGASPTLTKSTCSAREQACDRVCGVAMVDMTRSSSEVLRAEMSVTDGDAGVEGMHLGADLKLGRGVAVIGAPSHAFNMSHAAAHGSALVLLRSGEDDAQWSVVQRLVPPSSSSMHTSPCFGRVVSMVEHDDAGYGGGVTHTVAIGHTCTHALDLAHVYLNRDGVWSHAAGLSLPVNENPLLEQRASIGCTSMSISSDGSIILCGAYPDDALRGSVHVFSKNRIGQTREQQSGEAAFTYSYVHTHTHADSASGDGEGHLLGRSVTIGSPPTGAAYIGVHGASGHAHQRGHVRMHVLSGGNHAWWVHCESVSAPGAAAFDGNGFGSGVVLTSDASTLVVWALSVARTEGYVHVYSRARAFVRNACPYTYVHMDSAHMLSSDAVFARSVAVADATESGHVHIAVTVEGHVTGVGEPVQSVPYEVAVYALVDA